jgi:hypothetical protein
MSLVSALKRLAQSRGGKKSALTGHRDFVPRRYNLTTPAGLLESLEEDHRERLEHLFKSVQSNATPFNDGNTNDRGQLPCLQKLEARNRLRRVGLPEEVEPTALKFVNQFIDRGMKVEDEDADAT